MAFAANIIRPPSPRMSNPLEDYDDDDDSTDSDETPTTRPRSRSSFAPSNPPTGPSALPRPEFLFPPTLHSGRSSVSSTATNTPLPSRSTSPLPSRSTSPLPQFYHSNPSSSCTSDTDSEPISSLIRENRTLWWRRENRRKWWSISRRRRKRDGRIVRILKKWARRLVRHPFFPSQPITIVLTLILLSIFAIFLTLLLIYILNPDKEPLPWRSYCSASAPHDPLSSSPTSPHSDILYGNAFPPFLPSSVDIIPPAGVFVGVFSIDSGFERRMLVRTTWASHPHSRDGAGEGDGGIGTSRTVVRFVLGQPRKDWERRIKLEMEMYNDIIILPISENMNGGKSHSFFSWASINAWVPPVYTNSTVPPPRFSYSNNTVPPPPLAPHDSTQAWEDRHYGNFKPWVRPDYVVKVDDDSFVMLAELEWRLRLELHAKPQSPPSTNVEVTPTGNITHSSNSAMTEISSNPPRTHLSSSTTDVEDPLIYWGYLVKNRNHEFMAGELYALSWSLTEWVANDPVVKGMTRGAEDKQTAKWMRQHPQASEIRWASERCWIYDHPRSGTVYAHGFLFPSEVTRVKHGMMTPLEKTAQDILNNSAVAMGGTPPPPTPSAWAYSSVSTFGVRYTSPLPDLSTTHSVEALVEGSDMSTIREGGPMTPEYAWTHREGREKRYEGNRVGGTVVVHFIKKNMWYLETALALLEGEAFSESEKFQSRELEKATMESSSSAHPHSHTSRKTFSKYVRR